MGNVVGGGPKKVLYTLETVRKIGLRNSGKALKAKNACKACGLGMGGQLGGMTNEKQEFPSVCNKSIQAQSTDIQAPIPKEVFQHSLEELKGLSPRELEHMGRLNDPIFKAIDSEKFEVISWEKAFDLAAEKFRNTDPNRSFFYSSGRSSNEAAFLLQLFARLYGTNNLNNCSYYCHQASGVGLASTVGKSTSTISLNDLEKCDFIFVVGANPASNHPRFVHQLKSIRDRGGDVVIINPAKEPGLVKFSLPKSPKSLIKGGDYIASYYLQPKIQSDVWVMKGIAKAVLAENGEDIDFINQYTEGFGDFLTDIEKTHWEDIENATSLSRKEIEVVARAYCKAKNAVFAWGMGITHHLAGSDNVEYIANLALLRGMIGKQGSGLLPLRGHSNIQGVGTIGFKPNLPEETLLSMEKVLGVSLPRTKGLDTMACLDAATSGDMEAAFVLGGNLFGASPDREWAKSALDKVNFKLFLTTTLNEGHINGHEHSECLVLPVSARDEESEPTTQESMFNYIRMSSGGIKRLDKVKPESTVIAEIASRIIPKERLDFDAYRHHQSIRKTIAEILPEMDALRHIDSSKNEFHVENRLAHHPEFGTPNGKAQFVTREGSRSVTDKNYDFVAMSIRSEGQFNSIIYEEKDSYREVVHRDTVLMNSEDIIRLRLSNGNKVRVKSASGEMKNLEVKSFDLPQGNIMLYYPEANQLVGRNLDSRSKTPAFKSIPVNITPM